MNFHHRQIWLALLMSMLPLIVTAQAVEKSKPPILLLKDDKKSSPEIQKPVVPIQGTLEAKAEDPITEESADITVDKIMGDNDSMVMADFYKITKLNKRKTDDLVNGCRTYERTKAHRGQKAMIKRKM